MENNTMGNMYSPFSSMTFDYKHCFLCGDILSKENSTVEHVIPRWLQHKHDLWNQTLTLINKTTINYRNLVIPCCKDCNGNHLSRIENDIKNAVASGFSNIKDFDDLIIFKWITKIFYGLIFKDLTLSIDRSNPQIGNLMNPELLAKFKMVHEFLQAIRINIKFECNAFSLFVFNIHTDPRNDSKYDFFISDDILRTQIAIQSGDIGIVCCIGEDGIVKERLKDFLKPFSLLKIHPIQFREIIGRIYYTRALLQISPIYIMMNSKDEYSISSFLSSFTSDYFGDISQKDLAYYIYTQMKSLGFSAEQIYHPSIDAVLSYLTNHEGNVHIMAQDGEIIYDKKIKHDGFCGELFDPKIILADE